MGVRVDLPQRGSAELSGGQLPLAGGSNPLIPVKYIPVAVAYSDCSRPLCSVNGFETIIFTLVYY